MSRADASTRTSGFRDAASRLLNPHIHSDSMESTVTSHEPAAPAPVVEMRGISIGFPGVKALDGVDFRMFPGEVHSLMG